MSYSDALASPLVELLSSSTPLLFSVLTPTWITVYPPGAGASAGFGEEEYLYVGFALVI